MEPTAAAKPVANQVSTSVERIRMRDANLDLVVCGT
jgi:hypothetical protein